MDVKEILLTGILAVAITGCGGENEGTEPSTETPASLSELDISGTWLLTEERKITKKETGEYLLSNYYSTSYIFRETDIGVLYSSCSDYGSGSQTFGVKTEQHFYMNIDDAGFSLQGNGTLQRTQEYTLESEPELGFESIQTLTKISSGNQFDNGTLVLRGPISVEEYQHVCLHTFSANIGEKRALELTVPFEDRYLSLRFDFIKPLQASTYEYSTRDFDESDLLLDVYSPSSAFSDQVHSNTLMPRDVSITLVEATEAVVSGSYLFTGQDDEPYNGEFEIILP